MGDAAVREALLRCVLNAVAMCTNGSMDRKRTEKVLWLILVPSLSRKARPGHLQPSGRFYNKGAAKDTVAMIMDVETAKWTAAMNEEARDSCCHA